MPLPSLCLVTLFPCPSRVLIETSNVRQGLPRASWNQHKNAKLSSREGRMGIASSFHVLSVISLDP